MSKETKDDNIYMNISLNNNDTMARPAVFQQQLTNNLIDNPDDYYMSVIRFSLNGQSFPIFIFENDSYYVVLEYDGASYSQVVIYPGVLIPNIPNAMFSYQSFISAINTAFISCYAGLRALKPALPNPTTYPSIIPYMYYDPLTGVCSIFSRDDYYNIDTVATPVKIYMNSILYYFFDNFWNVSFGEGNTSKKDYQIVVKNIYNKNISTVTENGFTFTIDQMSQEYEALYRWVDQALIIFKSSLMGNRTEYTQGANFGSELANTNPSGSGIPVDTILTDFIASGSGRGGWREPITYISPNQYRLIDLLGRNSNQIDISIFWADKQGVQYPYLIPVESSVTIKLLFVKKSLYKNYKQEGHIAL